MLLDLRSLLEGAVAAVVEAVEDSRGYFFRRSAEAPAVGSRTRVRVARGWAEAEVVVAPSGSRRRAASGLVQVVADGNAAGAVARTLSRRTRRAVAAGDVLAFASSSAARVRSANPAVEAEAGVVLQGNFTRTRAYTRAGATIGIDVVAAELEEILFLLEVA